MESVKSSKRRATVKRFIHQSSECPICFVKFEDQVLGSPDGCEHVFCNDCIVKSALKTKKECPICRNAFESIRMTHKGIFLSETNIYTSKKRKTVDRYDFTTECEVCKSGDREQMILCGSCNLAFHTYCLTESNLKKVSGAWDCPTCTEVSAKKRTNLSKVEANQMKEEINQRTLLSLSQNNTSEDAKIPKQESGGSSSSSSHSENAPPDVKESHCRLDSVNSSSSHSEDPEKVEMDETKYYTFISDLENCEPRFPSLMIVYVDKHLFTVAKDGQLLYDMNDTEKN